MTAKEVFELRKQGQKEEAYEAARSLYATDKSPYTSLAMFWTAVDILRKLDWHSKHRDIDIIAQDGDTTVFVGHPKSTI